MGKIMINQREVNTPKNKIAVAELKELGGIPEREVLYDEEGNILNDEDVLDVSYPRRLGAVEEWTRG